MTDVSGRVRRCWVEKACSIREAETPSLVRENHQPRVEDDGKEYVAAGHHGEREDHCPVDAGDLPSRWHEVAREDEYHDEQKEADDQRKPETAQDPRHFDEEVRPLDLLLGRAPRDVVREQVREQGLRQVDRQTAKEEEAARRREKTRKKKTDMP